MVGEGVEAETSRSMTTFWSLGLQGQPFFFFLLPNFFFGFCGGQESKAVFVEPVSESPHTFFQISASFELGIYHHPNREFRKSVADEGTEVFWKSTKRIVAALGDWNQFMLLG